MSMPAKSRLVLFAATDFLGACSTTHRVDAPTFAAKVANADRVVLQTGETVSGQDRPEATSATAVVSVSHGRGALEGLGIGALSGLGVGAAVLALNASDCGDSILSCEEEIIATGVLLTLAGSAVGLVIGAISGSKDVFERAAPVYVAPQKDGGAAAGLSFSF